MTLLGLKAIHTTINLKELRASNTRNFVYHLSGKLKNYEFHSQCRTQQQDSQIDTNSNANVVSGIEDSSFFDDHENYNMTVGEGEAIIINLRFIEGCSERIGSNFDVWSLENVLKNKLKFKTTTIEDAQATSDKIFRRLGQCQNHFLIECKKLKLIFIF